MTRQIVAAALALVALAIGAGAGWAETPEKRIALVVGNDGYQTLPRLGNATADARDLGRALEGAGFETTIKMDVKRRELYQLIDAFAARIAGSPDTVGVKRRAIGTPDRHAKGTPPALGEACPGSE